MSAKKDTEAIYITKSGHKINAKQELFCQLYSSSEEFFCNGIKSYAKAYGIDISTTKGYNVAKSGASKMLTNGYILERINEIFESRGLNDEFVDKQLERMITQETDLNVKMKAIAEYNKLRQRITEKQDITSNGQALEAITIKLVDASRKDGDGETGQKDTPAAT